MRKFEKSVGVRLTDKQLTEQMATAEPEMLRAACQDQEPTIALFRAYVEAEMSRCQLWLNDEYQVAVYPPEANEGVTKQGWPPVIHLSIKRIDREPVHDWRDLQEIKNLIVGPDHEAVELYPAESRKVDLANQYHLWVLADAGIHFPFGFETRAVQYDNAGGAKQRPEKS